MAKKKPPYVAPQGLPMAPHPKVTQSQRWEWLAECSRDLKTWIPEGEEPQTMGWQDPHESIRKERAERLQAEADHVSAMRAAFDTLMTTKLWPETDDATCFLMRERLDWAAGVAMMFAALAMPPKTDAPPYPEASLKDLWGWMLFDLYERKTSWPKKWWDRSSFEDWHGI